MSQTAWLWLGAIVLAIIAVNWWAKRSQGAKHKSIITFNAERLHERIAVGRKFYLETLQRELANVILSQDLEMFEKTFYAMREWEADIERCDKSRHEAEYNLILQKFPNLEDFDLIGTKHFIRYDESPTWSLDDAAERYKEISKFLILDPERPAGLRGHSFDRETKIFSERIQKYKDKRLKDGMDEAMGRYYAWRQDRDTKDEFKDRDYEVVSLMGHPSRGFTPEIEYGIVCKKLNECGIYSFFVDDGRNKTYYHYHRSDPMFSKTDVLMHF